MKLCPICQTNYDDTQNYCLNDGTTLVSVSQTSGNLPNEPATVIRPNPPSRVDLEASPQESKTGLLIALTAAATLLLVGLGLGAYYLLVPSVPPDTAQKNQNVVPVETNNRNSNPPPKPAVTPAKVNAAASPAASVAPISPKPVLTTAQIDEIKKDVDVAVAGWKQTTQNEDLNAHISSYAPTVDYYKGGKVAQSRVRADRQKAFETYDDLNVEIRNVKLTPDPSGTKTVVVFDKDYRFANAETVSEGSVQQQLILEKIDGRWLITSEKDLKIYRKSK